MKKLLLVATLVAVAFAFRPSPPGFKTDFEAAGDKLMAYALAVKNGGDTVTTKADLLAAVAVVKSYGDLEANMEAAYGPGWKTSMDTEQCKHACDMFFIGCDLSPLSFSMCFNAWKVCINHCVGRPIF